MWCPKFRLRIEREIITYLKTNGEVENGLLSRFPSAAASTGYGILLHSHLGLKGLVSQETVELYRCAWK